jgi:hypothetical protein
MERSHVKENIPEHLPGDNREEYNCDDCDFQSNNNNQLRKHIDLKHRSNFQCDNCEIILGSKTDLDAHIQEKHKSYRPCRNFASNECEYEGECKFHHIILQRGQQICYKCGDKFSNKTDLIRHIKSEHGNEEYKKFKETECDYGTKCLFKHSNIIERSRQTLPTPQDFQPLTPPANPQVQVFQERPTSQIPLNILNMIPQIVSQIVIALSQQNQPQIRI